MRRIGQIVTLFAALMGALLGQPTATDSGVRFQAVDIFLNPHGKPLAAYQLEFLVTTGQAQVVGVEGGEHPAFKEAPFYDPKAIQQERVIVAAFNTGPGDRLPAGRTRVATIHLRVTGERNAGHEVKLETAATVDGMKIPVETTLEERKPE